MSDTPTGIRTHEFLLRLHSWTCSSSYSRSHSLVSSYMHQRSQKTSHWIKETPSEPKTCSEFASQCHRTLVLLGFCLEKLLGPNAKFFAAYYFPFKASKLQSSLEAQSII